jgi:hypothetical protein
VASRITATAVNVLNSAPTLLTSAGYHRKSLSIINGGPNAIYLGPSDVATTTGFTIAAGATAHLADFFIPEGLYAIAGTADQTSPANTRVLQSFDG